MVEDLGLCNPKNYRLLISKSTSYYECSPIAADTSFTNISSSCVHSIKKACKHIEVSISKCNIILLNLFVDMDLGYQTAAQ